MKEIDANKVLLFREEHPVIYLCRCLLRPYSSMLFRDVSGWGFRSNPTMLLIWKPYEVEIKITNIQKKYKYQLQEY